MKVISLIAVYQKGLGLPELLIALVLASFITTGLMHNYLVTKKQYTTIQKKLECDIDLQLVTDLIRESVRQAGFTPCLSLDHLVTRDQREKHKPLVAVDFGLSPKPWLRLSRMSPRFDMVLDVVTSTQLLATSNQPLHRDQSIMIADCYHGEVHNIIGIEPTPQGQSITLSKPLAFEYHQPIYIADWLEERYFIRSGHTGESTLFYQYQHAEELTAAIHTFSTRVVNIKEHRVLQLILGMDNAPAIKIETMIRAW
jgi:hypothetical protein